MNKNYSYLILLILISLSIRVGYAAYRPTPLITADSIGYYGLGNKILKNPSFSTIINQYRTPLYPVFISSVASSMGYTTDDMYRPAFLPIGNWITHVQSFFSIVSICVIYFLLLDLSLPMFWAFIVSVFIACNIFIFSWERAFVTDSLGFSVLVWITYATIRLIRKPTPFWYISLGVLSTIGWLLRPNLLIIPVISFIILVFADKKRKYVALNCIVFMLTIGLSVLYVQANYFYHGYAGISQVVEINLLGQILKFNLPVDPGKEFTFYYNAVQEYRSHNGEPMPFRFIDTYDPTIYIDITKINELQQFVRTVIRSNIITYIVSAIAYIPNVFSDIVILVKVQPQHNNILSYVFYGLQEFYRVVWHSGYLLFLLWPISIWMYKKQPTNIHLILVFLGAVSISEILLTIFMVEDDNPGQEYARLVSIIQPQTYIFFSIMCYNQINKIKQLIASILRGGKSNNLQKCI